MSASVAFPAASLLLGAALLSGAHGVTIGCTGDACTVLGDLLAVCHSNSTCTCSTGYSVPASSGGVTAVTCSPDSTAADVVVPFQLSFYFPAGVSANVTDTMRTDLTQAMTQHFGSQAYLDMTQGSIILAVVGTTTQSNINKLAPEAISAGVSSAFNKYAAVLGNVNVLPVVTLSTTGCTSIVAGAAQTIAVTVSSGGDVCVASRCTTPAYVATPSGGVCLPSDSDDGLEAIHIAGIVVASCILGIVIFGAIVFFACKTPTENKPLESLAVPTEPAKEAEVKEADLAAA